MKTPALLSLAAGAALASSCLGQVTLTRIIDESTPVGRFRGTGTRLALDGDTIALIGADRGTQLDGVYYGPVTAPGNWTRIADTAATVPGLAVPFDRFYGVDISGGRVLFTGAIIPSSFFQITGTYLSSGSGFSTLIPVPTQPGEPPAALIASMDEGGIAYRAGSPYYNTYVLNTGGSPFPLWNHGDPAPGGGTFIKGDIGDSPARDGGVVALTAYVAAPTGAEGGVYVYPAAGGPGTLIANWDTAMPGSAANFDFFPAVDTDGVPVAFTGKSGVVGQGGFEGVYAAPASGAGPVTRIADLSTGVPGDGGTFTALGQVAVQGDIVVFEGYKGVAWSPDYEGLFARRLSGGPIVKVLSTLDSLGGQRVKAIDFNFRALSGSRVAFDVQLVDSAAPGGVGYAVYLATLQLPGACYPDCNADAALNLSDFGCFTTKFATADPYADCNADGVRNLSDFGCFTTKFALGCP